MVVLETLVLMANRQGAIDEVIPAVLVFNHELPGNAK